MQLLNSQQNSTLNLAVASISLLDGRCVRRSLLVLPSLNLTRGAALWHNLVQVGWPGGCL